MTNTLQNLSDTYTNGLLITIGIFASLWIFRLLLVIKNKKERVSIFKCKNEPFVVVLKIIFALAMIALLIDIPVWFLTVSQFRIIVSPILYGIFIFVIASLAIQELILSFTVSNSLINQFIKRILFFLASIFCLLAFGAATFIAPKTYVFPPVDECVLLDLPVKGVWFAAHAGQLPWVNYHSAYKQQQFAIDIVKLDENGHFFVNEGNKCSDFISFGDSVFAPLSGVVYNCLDSLNSQVIMNGNDSINPAGNFVEIKFKSNYLFLAHLLKGSVQVNKGDTVISGQWLGLSGNSGNTTWPHLHMHIQNKPGIFDTLAVGQPFRFNSIYRNRWFGFQKIQNAYLLRNDKFSN